jgi:hypothetical protein
MTTRMSELDKLRELERDALGACKNRGHSMEKCWTDFRTRQIVSKFACRHCGMEVWCDTHPAPNGIDIGGPAVALNCTGKLDSGNAT